MIINDRRSRFGIIPFVPFVGAEGAYGAFEPSVSINPPARIPQRVATILAVEKLLKTVASAPAVSTSTAVASMQSFYAVAAPLVDQAFTAYQADYVLALWAAGDPGVPKSVADLSASVANNWVIRADKMIATAPSGWSVYLAEAQQQVATMLQGALDFQQNVSEVVQEAAKKASRSLFDIVPWYAWALLGAGVIVYLDIPRRLSAGRP